MSNSPTILVTDSDRGSALAIIRSLGRRGWHVVAAGPTPGSLGFRSRYAREGLVYPDPQNEPDDFVATLLIAAMEKNVDLIVPVTDNAILPLSAARAQFKGVCKLALPAQDALEVTTNKLKTMELAKRLGIPVPNTVLVRTAEEACEHGWGLGWPIVLKPQVSKLYRKGDSVEAYGVSYAASSQELETQMRRFEGRCPVLLQEYYAGTGAGVELLLYRGRTLAAFQHKRLREIPIYGGASAFRESVPIDPLMYDYSTTMLGALNWTGLAMIEFKVGEEGPKLMEINGRVWGSLPLAVLSGMDFPGRMAELYLCAPPTNDAPPVMDYTVGVRARNFELEILWIASVILGNRHYPYLNAPKRSQGFAALLELFNPKYKYDVLSIDDPLPGFGEIIKIGRKIVNKSISSRS